MKCLIPILSVALGVSLSLNCIQRAKTATLSQEIKVSESRAYLLTVERDRAEGMADKWEEAAMGYKEAAELYRSTVDNLREVCEKYRSLMRENNQPSRQ